MSHAAGPCRSTWTRPSRMVMHSDGICVTAYYNEMDSLKAAVLREAIKAGAIAPVTSRRRLPDLKWGGGMVPFRECGEVRG
jgi:hypothetical protein